jgi:hypothetical protein
MPNFHLFVSPNILKILDMILLTCGVIAGSTERKETTCVRTWGHLYSYYHTEKLKGDEDEITA